MEKPKELPEKQRPKTKYQHTSDLPRPYSCTLYKTLDFKLKHWNNDAKILAKDHGLNRSKKERKRQVFLYLNEQLRNLPIPGQKGGEIWEELDNPQDILELLHPLFCTLYECHKYPLSIHDSVELTTSFHTLYAIVDTLSRRCPEAHIPENINANGKGLTQWMGNPAIKIVNPKTYEKLTHLATYFGLDPLKYYTDEEDNEYMHKRLFNFQGRLSILSGTIYTQAIHFLHVHSIISHETDRKLLEDKEIQRKLRLHGIEDKAPYVLKKVLLFSDPPLERALENEPPSEKRDLLRKDLEQGTHKMDKRKGILPRPLYLLRLIHLLAQNIAHGRSGSKKSFDRLDKSSIQWINSC